MSWRPAVLWLVACVGPGLLRAEEAKRASVAPFVGGAVLGLAAHESGHLLFDLAFDADPALKKVDFAGIPFFAITHRSGLTPRRELTVSSAGFWVQYASSEWLLTRRPGLRAEHAPVAKGFLAFHVLASVAYAGVAFAHAGPAERDTRGMATSLRMDEVWVGAIVLAPAALDSYRYLHPGARWARWASRGAKLGAVLLVLK